MNIVYKSCEQEHGAHPAHLAQLNALLKELSPENSSEIFAQDWHGLVHANGTHIVVAVDTDAPSSEHGTDYTIAGFGVLVVQPPRPMRVSSLATFEDIIVSSAYRGQKIGEQICTKLIDIARTEGIAKIQLTSRTRREAARNLYKKLGFIPKHDIVISDHATGDVLKERTMFELDLTK